MKPKHILFIVGTMLLFSQWSFTVSFSGAAEEEENILQYGNINENEYKRMLEEEAEPSDKALELEEQINESEHERMLEEELELSDEAFDRKERIDEPDRERMLEEEAEPSDEAFELEEQFNDLNNELMPEENALPLDENSPGETDMFQEENTSAQ